MFNNFVWDLLTKIDKEVVIDLYKKGSTAQEIADKLGKNLYWVEDIIEEYQIEFVNDLNAELQNEYI